MPDFSAISHLLSFSENLTQISLLSQIYFHRNLIISTDSDISTVSDKLPQKSQYINWLRYLNCSSLSYVSNIINISYVGLYQISHPSQLFLLLCLLTYIHMVKCYENAYRPKNLSLFAFNVEGYWGQIKKKLKETKSQMFLSMFLHLWKCFAFLHGVQKIAE